MLVDGNTVVYPSVPFSNKLLPASITVAQYFFCLQIWNLGSPEPNFTLDAHMKGVNCVDYFTGGDRPYLITGSDDHTAKVSCLTSKSQGGQFSNVYTKMTISLR